MVLGVCVVLIGFYEQVTQLSQTGRATFRVVENLAVTQGRSGSFEITPLSKPCVSSYHCNCAYVLYRF